MLEFWLPVSDIPAAGREFVFDDQELWREGWRAFAIGLQPGRDLVARVTIQPQGTAGVLIRGRLTGSVIMACDRCANDFECPVDEGFEAFVQPPEGAPDEEPRLRVRQGQVELDIGAILWEEFAVALPLKPLCAEGCLGVCPRCGQDLNLGPCACAADQDDPRLAVLRNLKVK